MIKGYGIIMNTICILFILKNIQNMKTKYLKHNCYTRNQYIIVTSIKMLVWQLYLGGNEFFFLGVFWLGFSAVGWAFARA